MQSIPRPAMPKSSYKKRDEVKSMCSDMNCQETQNINMQPVKPPMDMWLPKPAVPYQYKRLCSDKNCQPARCFKKKCPVRAVCDDKNC